ncbi:FAD/NAD-P-binding domain-containing protein [Panus rudis PR-1116 ss-1]|nr:FAD/NAD-P-binding domain-containing protein [Panus rudis PR-1116 ss-1]
MTATPRKAIVVGAGPVGCLSAISLAKMGWSVEVYEGRPDMRLPSSKAAAQQRSINLAISARGITALQAIEPGASGRFLRAAIPMRGRMIHDLAGKTNSQPYDRNGQCINSIDRALLNEDLLEEALSVPNIAVFFSHKVLSIDFDGRVINLHDAEEKTDKSVHFDLCIGADGSYSIVRRQLMRVVRMNFAQEYIPHEYLELRMPSGPPKHDGEGPTFLLDPNHLHIWPRHSFMLIALPNQDKSFTCTLFAPTAEFNRLDSPDAIIDWFKTNFPDALPLIGEQALLRDFERNPRSPLISIKAMPYHYKDRVILLGDAAHSMVPFYGQGLNCGLEDVRVLDQLLRSHQVDPNFRPSEDALDERLAKALQEYTETRHEDLVTICDLAMDNYTEMRHSVTTPAYILRKALDDFLYSLTSQQMTPLYFTPEKQQDPFPTRWPSGWLPLYTMVTFRPDISYATVKRKAQRQNQIISYAAWLSAAVAVGTASAAAFTVWKRLRK